MMNLSEIKKKLEVVDQFREKNARILVPIHELPSALDQRSSIEVEIVRLFKNLRNQVCTDNNFPRDTPFSRMPDSSVVSEKAESKLCGLLGYLDWIQCR
jgi:hypothetical protein